MGGTKVSAASRTPAGVLVGVMLLSAMLPAPSGAAQQNVTWFADPHPAAAQTGAGH
jgi:hypothetical protein